MLVNMFLCDKPVLTKNQERGFLGDLITAPIDLADCMGKCVSIPHFIISSTSIYLLFLFQPISPLEFAKCSVECGKGSSKERGLLGDLITGPIDLAQCIGKCVSVLHFMSTIRCFITHPENHSIPNIIVLHHVVS